MIRVVRSAVIDAPIERVWAVLRDFNSHSAWHPIVADSTIENDEPSDQIGCVRSFTLKDGNHIREQLLALSDTDYVSTYCILDATLPMRRYVAMVQLKRVTDGDRTFWHWQSTFDVPRGREQEFADLVGKGVYEGGFEGVRAYLRRRPGAPTSRSTVTGGASITTQGVVAVRFGGADVLELRSLEARPPGAGEVRLRQTAIGINYIDVYVRKGEYPLIQPPAPLGMEAAGEVVDVGDGVTHLLPGDRVAYACTPPGAYVGVRTLPASHVVVLPDEIDDETAAAAMLKGMTAEYLLHRTHRLRAGETVLIHAAAGGVGLLLCQWAKALGARVIGTVSSDIKARTARAAGCDFVIVGGDYRFAASVRDATDGRGADVIYDGLGQAAARENFDALAMCSHWVCYGQASGPVSRLTVEDMQQKSATFSSPVLFHYSAERTVLTEMAGRTFEALRQGILTLDIQHRYPLAAAAQAHRDLEGRTTIGPLILLP